MNIKTSSAIFAAALTAVTPFGASAAESKNSPVFPQFNSNDVNGTVTVIVPDGYTADIAVTFDSPEGTDIPYYDIRKVSGGECSLDIEGRNNTKDDYRYYELAVTITGGSRISEVFKDIINGNEKESFLIPDPNDTPDSYKNYTYKFTVDDTDNGKSWEITAADKTSKTVSVHLNAIIQGDVNDDGKVDGIDASKVLTSYAMESAGKRSELTEKQQKAADVNSDGKVDANDASLILSFYAYNSAGNDVTLADYIKARKK